MLFALIKIYRPFYKAFIFSLRSMETIENVYVFIVRVFDLPGMCWNMRLLVQHIILKVAVNCGNFVCLACRVDRMWLFVFYSKNFIVPDVPFISATDKPLYHIIFRGC